MVRLLATLALLAALAPAPVDRAIDAIAARPPYAHANIGVEAIDLANGRTVYARNADRLFVPGSTTKLITAGSALALLGPDHRFHTRVYRTGDVDAAGVLRGDLVLVASGDPNLSNRIRPDGTLAFEDEDHSYGGPDVKPVDGDPLAVIDALAAQVAAHGIRHVAGSVRIDASLFPEGEREGGTGVVIAPVVVNDNVVDVMAAGGAAEGDAATVKTQPETAYVRFRNRLKTGSSSSRPSVEMDDKDGGDGTRVVTLSGTLPAGKSGLASWAVTSPARFAAVVLAERLNAHGIVAAPPPSTQDAGPAADSHPASSDDRIVAEHVSLPMTEEIKVMLKVSQNLHASMMPSVLGATLAAHGSDPPLQRGFDRIKSWLDGSRLDLSGASQGDGAGAQAHFTPHFMASYLVWMTKQPFADVYRRALPVMGRDGTLVAIQVKSPAAGHVFAKTGTYGEADRLHRALMVDGKGLAGYVDTAGGRRLAFAAYINFVRVPPDGAQQVGEALGEIASALYAAY